jgi:hypothetical protein
VGCGIIRWDFCISNQFRMLLFNCTTVLKWLAIHYVYSMTLWNGMACKNTWDLIFIQPCIILIVE